MDAWTPDCGRGKHMSGPATGQCGRGAVTLGDYVSASATRLGNQRAASKWWAGELAPPGEREGVRLVRSLSVIEPHRGAASGERSSVTQLLKR